MKEKINSFKLSVRNLVEFIMRSGDIDNRISDSMSKSAMLEGSKMHRKIQASMGSSYQAEVPLSIELNYEKYSIIIEGRADGIICEGSDTVVDEIKTMYSDVMKLKEPVRVHKAQAMCYAYIYAKQQCLSEISIQMTYCNLDNEMIKRFKETFTYEEIEVWFESLLTQYIVWVEYMADEKIRRAESIANLEFPFDYRKGQRDIVVSVYKGIKQQKNMYIQAPTGVGKTMSTIFPAVRAVGENAADKIFYLTAKTITRTVAEEAFTTLRKNGLHFKTVTITAKEKICPSEEIMCNPVACQRAKGHFDRINAALFDLISNEETVTREIIERYAEEYNVCPFEMSLDVSNFMDGIICDYNYVFDPNVYLKRYFAQGVKGEYVFLVDEAHNLVERAREMYSAVLTKEDFLQAKRIIKDIKYSGTKRLYNALEKCNKEMLSYKRMTDGYQLLDDIDEFVKILLRMQSVMEKFMDENKEFTDRDKVLDLYFAVRNFVNIYELVNEKYRMYSDFTDKGEFFIKLFCVNPSDNIKNCMDRGFSTVFFSATLLPVNYYKELLSGDLEDYAIYINSPFDVHKRTLTVATDVSSKYTRRGREEYLKILSYIESITTQCQGNYLVFFPSYKLMDEIVRLADETGMLSESRFITQTVNMDEEQREDFLQRFDKDNDKTLIGFCVLGGIFSEGIDLKNERLIGSIIIGTGLPQVCNEREILKKYFDESNRNGFDYAYKYPGMNKVLQAAGRVIRTDEDYGVIALLDERFLQRSYLNLFPREWEDFQLINAENVGELVSHFWKYV